MRAEEKKLKDSLKKVAQKPIESYEFYMSHLVNEAEEMGGIVKGAADNIVQRLMNAELEK